MRNDGAPPAPTAVPEPLAVEKVPKGPTRTTRARLAALAASAGPGWRRARAIDLMRCCRLMPPESRTSAARAHWGGQRPRRVLRLLHAPVLASQPFAHPCSPLCCAISPRKYRVGYSSITSCYKTRPAKGADVAVNALIYSKRTVDRPTEVGVRIRYRTPKTHISIKML